MLSWRISLGMADKRRPIVAKDMTKDMTKGSTFKLLLLFAIPVFFGNLFQQLYNVVDSIVVGHFDSVEAFAAVGATSSLVFLVFGWITGITNGFGVLLAQAFGAKDHKLLRHYTAMSVYLCVAMTLLLTGILIPLNRSILEFLNTPESIISGAQAYIGIIYGGLIVTVMYNMLASILRALGDSKTPLYFLLFAAIVHAILDVVFVGKFGMGVKGVAYATIISQGMSALLCFIFMWKKYEILRLEKEDLRFSIKSAGRLLGMGIPMGLQFSITAIGTMIVQAALNQLGPHAIAAFSAASKIQNFVSQMFPAVGLALATYVGQNIGAGAYDRVKKGVRQGIWMCLISSTVTVAIVLLFSDQIVHIFIANPPEEVLRLSRTYFMVVAWFYPVLSLIFIFRDALQGMGNGIVPMLGGVFELIARALIIQVAAKPLGYVGICMSDPLAWIFALIPTIPVYYIQINRMIKRQQEKRKTLKV